MSVSHQEEQLRAADGTLIHCQQWRPESPIGVLVIAHGAFEHGGRYAHVARHYTARGLHVFAVDHRGHGRSGGGRACLAHFSDYINDLGLVMAKARTAGAGLPVVLLGHSMGGLLALSYALEYPEQLNGLILTSPWLRLRTPLTAMQRAQIAVLGRLAPKFRLPFKRVNIARDPEIDGDAQQDPLMGSVLTPGWARAIQERQDVVATTQHGLQVPTLFLQAGADALVSAQATQVAHDQAAVKDKQFKLYPDMYHEILNDTKRALVFADIDEWLHARGWLAQ